MNFNNFEMLKIKKMVYNIIESVLHSLLHNAFLFTIINL